MFEELLNMEQYEYCGYNYWIISADNERIQTPLMLQNGWILSSIINPHITNEGLNPSDSEKRLISKHLERGARIFKVRGRFMPILLGSIYLMTNPQNDAYVKLVDKAISALPNEILEKIINIELPEENQ